MAINVANQQTRKILIIYFGQTDYSRFGQIYFSNTCFVLNWILSKKWDYYLHFEWNISLKKVIREDCFGYTKFNFMKIKTEQKTNINNQIISCGLKNDLQNEW